jgi:hypothetical protein
MVENLQAYYLIPGALARVIRDDHANGMSEILLAGILTPLWTYTKFLTARPIQDTYGVIETPANAGLVDPRDAAIVGETGGKTLNERAQASTPWTGIQNFGPFLREWTFLSESTGVQNSVSKIRCLLITFDRPITIAIFAMVFVGTTERCFPDNR